MKKMNNAEMRKVNGGYRLVCNYCGKTKHTKTKVGVTAFFLHGHPNFVCYDIWNYPNAMKSWG